MTKQKAWLESRLESRLEGLKIEAKVKLTKLSSVSEKVLEMQHSEGETNWPRSKREFQRISFK